MRRTTRAIVALALVSVVTAGVGAPADAHFCSTPLQVPVGRPVTFTVGVPAEDVPVARVDIEIPKGFDLHRGIEFAAWKVERRDDVLSYTGGTIRLFNCAFFTLAGEVPEKTTLVVPFTTYAADGSVIRAFRSRTLNHADAAQLVYAGVDPAHEPADPDAGGPAAFAIAGWVLIAGGAVGGVVLFLRRRRTAGG